MKLHETEFGNVLGASGVQGFFGEGYPHYRIPLRTPDFRGMTSVWKTVTLKRRPGNIKKNRWILEYIFPSWARVKWSSGHTLNAMGLPNISLEALLELGIWQKYPNPSFISIMAVEDTPEKRLDEMKAMVDIIGEHKNDFSAPFGIQINRSCPNLRHNVISDIVNFIKESCKGFEVASALGVPIMEKYAIDTTPYQVVKELNNHPSCDAICVSNTLKFGWKEINWKKVWGSDVSPLAHLRGGGLSGPALLPHVCRWIEKLRDAGFTKPINGGGGIFCKEDVDKYKNAGADSIFIGTVATHHPWRVQGIIQRANQLKW